MIKKPEKKKIQKTFHWPTLFGRKRNSKYQIPCGHHRLVALKELGIQEIDFTEREISDADMVLIMADENHRIDMSPQRTNQTILDVKTFLDKELAKYKTWEEARVDKFVNTLFGNAGNFENTKETGVGRTIILKFLGGNWKQGKMTDKTGTDTPQIRFWRATGYSKAMPANERPLWAHNYGWR